MLIIPTPVLHRAAALESGDAWLVTKAETTRSWHQDGVNLHTVDLTDERMAAFAVAALEVGDKSFARVVESIINARDGKFDKSVPKLTALPEMLSAYLYQHMIDGWLYKQHRDGTVEAFAVTRIEYNDGAAREDKPYVIMSLAYTGSLDHSRGERGGRGQSIKTLSWDGADVVKKKVADIVNDEGYLVETLALRAKYDEQTDHHREVLAKGYTEQYRYTGRPITVNDGSDRWGGRENYDRSPRLNRKVIDVTPAGGIIIAETTTSTVFVEDIEGAQPTNPETRKRKGDRDVEPAVLALPMQHLIQVFDLTTQEFMVVRSSDMVRYEYDSSLANKLVLPSSHRDLLDILTTDIATFTGDIIEGKSAGNVVLAKGEPGVGKTLTAEVYSELIERPLYSIHSGSLGVTADSVRQNLTEVFKRAKAWNAVLLLDEADVFVNERGLDITQNAIVAEFLRTMEYFDGLMFMTTNRASNIDEAVLSRCAAVIAYEKPGFVDAVKIWKVLAENFGAPLSDDLASDLAKAFFDSAPRDFKMLLRLALRVSAHEKVDLSLDVFRKVSMFRGVTFHVDDIVFATQKMSAF